VFGGRRPRRAAPRISRVDFRNPARPAGAKLAALEAIGKTLAARLATAFSSMLQGQARVESAPVRSGALRDVRGGAGEAAAGLVLEEPLEDHLALRLLGVPPAAEGETPQAPSPVERTPMVRAALEGAVGILVEAANAVLQEAECRTFRLHASGEPCGAALTETEAAHAFEFTVREGTFAGKLTVVLPDRALRPLLSAREHPQPPSADPAAAKALEAAVRGLELGVTARLGGAEVSLFDEVLHLEVGDVLVLDRRIGEPVELLAGGQTLFEGHLGTARGRLGIRLGARRQD
jgi:flagellar motor switch protein FliM